MNYAYIRPQVEPNFSNGDKAMWDNAAVSLNIEFNKLFEPDELAPVQFYKTRKRSCRISPELLLMAAVLEDAVTTLTVDSRRCSKHQRREIAEAIRWIDKAQDEDYVFSFVNVCESLAMDPDYVRAGLIRKTQQIRDTPSLVLRSKVKISIAAPQDRTATRRSRIGSQT